MTLSTEAIETTGYVAGSLTTLSFFPQLIAIYRSKSSKDLSWGYLLAFAIGISFWLVYGFMLQRWPIILANAIVLVQVVGIIFMKVKYDK